MEYQEHIFSDQDRIELLKLLSVNTSDLSDEV